MHIPVGERGRGNWLVAALVSLALGLAVFALWFQWRQTRHCLAFYGPEAAARIRTADRVELWDLVEAAETGTVRPLRRSDISAARGLVHLRRGLVEDANFEWPDRAADPSARRTWDAALAFIPSGATDGGETVLLLDLDEPPGAIAIAGRRGELRLGRIGPGLRSWLADARGGTGQ